MTDLQVYHNLDVAGELMDLIGNEILQDTERHVNGRDWDVWNNRGDTIPHSGPSIEWEIVDFNDRKPCRPDDKVNWQKEGF